MGIDTPKQNSDRNIDGQNLDQSNPMPDAPEQTKEEKQRKKDMALADKQRDELIAERMGESPDLNEVIEKLKPNVLSVQKFLDGSFHLEQKDRVVMISELEQEINSLNQEIAKLKKNENMKFRAVDLWASVIDMPITPNEININFPHPGPNLKNYNRGSVTPQFGVYLQINADKLSLIDSSKEDVNKPKTSGFDSLMFSLMSTGKISKTRSAQVISGNNSKEKVHVNIVQRALSYGLDVRTFRKDPAFDFYQDTFIDLKSSGYEVENAQYLIIETIEGNRFGGEAYLTNKKPRAYDNAKMEKELE